MPCQLDFTSPQIASNCFCRGLSLRGCEDIDDTAVLIVSKYTAAADQDLLQRLSSLEVASSSTAGTAHPAGSPSKATLPITPTYRNVSLQRTLLGNTLLGVRQAVAPNNPHKQPVLDCETDAEQTQGSTSAEVELQRLREQLSRQRSSLHTGKPYLCCACPSHLAPSFAA